MGKAGFRAETNLQEEIRIEDYKNKWVILNVKQIGNLAGKLSQVNQTTIALLPYQATDYNEGGEIYRIEREGLPYLVERENVVGLRPFSEQNIESFCKFINKKPKE